MGKRHVLNFKYNILKHLQTLSKSNLNLNIFSKNEIYGKLKLLFLHHGSTNSIMVVNMNLWILSIEHIG